jgi:hypothetical protein
MVILASVAGSYCGGLLALDRTLYHKDSGLSRLLLGQFRGNFSLSGSKIVLSSLSLEISVQLRPGSFSATRARACRRTPGLRESPGLLRGEGTAGRPVALLAPSCYMIFRPEEEHCLSS